MLLRPRQILAPVIFATVFGYFGYHLVNGDRGLLAMAHLQREVHDRQPEPRRGRDDAEDLGAPGLGAAQPEPRSRHAR